MQKKLKICFVSSSGGHFEQLMMLKPLMEKYESFIVTEKTLYDTDVMEEKKYYLHQVNRKEWKCILLLLINAIKSVNIFFLERPEVVISTGVLSTIPLCLIAKFFGSKLIYIESFAKVTTATETGKLMYKFADQFYVQWKSMLKIFPNAIYLGGIY